MLREPTTVRSIRDWSSGRVSAYGLRYDMGTLDGFVFDASLAALRFFAVRAVVLGGGPLMLRLLVCFELLCRWVPLRLEPASLAAS